MDEITPQELKARLAGSDRPLLLDVRQDWETRLARLENAVHIPIEEMELRVDELNADDEIVVYCCGRKDRRSGNGMRAIRTRVVASRPAGGRC